MYLFPLKQRNDRNSDVPFTIENKAPIRMFGWCWCNGDVTMLCLWCLMSLASHFSAVCHFASPEARSRRQVSRLILWLTTALLMVLSLVLLEDHVIYAVWIKRAAQEEDIQSACDMGRHSCNSQRRGRHSKTILCLGNCWNFAGETVLFWILSRNFIIWIEGWSEDCLAEIYFSPRYHIWL